MTEQINYVAEVIESVNKEYNDFYNEMMQQSKEEIFNNGYKIYVYTALHDYIEMEIMDEVDYRCLYEERGSLLALLYDEYINNEDFNIENDIDKVEFFDWYNHKFHNDILEGESELG